MKITYYVGKIDSLFRKHEPASTLRNADRILSKNNTITDQKRMCFVYVDNTFVHSFAFWERWCDYRDKRGYRRTSTQMYPLFERWIRLKLRCLQRTQPPA